jgi:hypothetical protein
MPPERQITTRSVSVILILFCKLTRHLYSTFLNEHALHIDSPLYIIDPGVVLHLKQFLVFAWFGYTTSGFFSILIYLV